MAIHHVQLLNESPQSGKGSLAITMVFDGILRDDSAGGEPNPWQGTLLRLEVNNTTNQRYQLVINQPDRGKWKDIEVGPGRSDLLPSGKIQKCEEVVRIATQSKR